MIGYKAAYNYKCLNQWYEVGDTYSFDEKPILCKRGFHYCKNLGNVFLFYSMGPRTNIFEIKALGDIDYDRNDICEDPDEDMFIYKYATNSIKIVRELSDLEIIGKLNLTHEYDEINRILTYKTINGFWITKVYDENNICKYYSDSLGCIAKYNYAYGQNRPTQIETDLVKLLGKHGENTFNDEVYHDRKFLRMNHSLELFKNTHQKQMFERFEIKFENVASQL